MIKNKQRGKHASYSVQPLSRPHPCVRLFPKNIGYALLLLTSAQLSYAQIAYHTEQQPQTQPQSSDIGHLSADVLHQVGKLEQMQPDDYRQYSRISTQIQTLILQNEANIRPFTRFLTQYKPSDVQFKGVLQGFIRAGTLAAQSNLIKLMQQLTPVQKQYDAIFNQLAFVNLPASQTVDFYLQVLSLPSSTTSYEYAAVSLGTMALSLVEKGIEEDHERGRQIVHTLMTYLEKATEIKEMGVFIRALGNAGHPDAMPLLLPYLNNELLDSDTRNSLDFIDPNGGWLNKI